LRSTIFLFACFSQQLANIAVGGTNERRYFTGVEGEKDRKGELFGLENLFSYRAEGASLSKDIVKRTEKLEAGYEVAKYEIVHEKKEENGLENQEKVSDFTIKRVIQFLCHTFLRLFYYLVFHTSNSPTKILMHKCMVVVLEPFFPLMYYVAF